MSDEHQRMHCPSCGADWFSAAAATRAAAATLVASGARCLRCDGELVLADAEAGPGKRGDDRQPRPAENGPTGPPDT